MLGAFRRTPSQDSGRDYLWAARKDLDPQVAKKIAAAFLALDPAKAEDHPIEVLEAAGATAPIRSLWGGSPQVRPLVASYALLRWEFNLRVSALVGFLGGGGLGLKLYNAIQLSFYDQVGTMVLLIFGLVVLSDSVSDALRRNWLAPATLRREAGVATEASLPAQVGGLAA